MSVEANQQLRMKRLDDLLTEREPRWIGSNTNGTLRGTLPRDHAEHVGLGSGAPMQVSVCFGDPVVIDEPCLIIRPHPVGDHNE